MDAEQWQSRGTERTWRVVDAVNDIAAEEGQTPPQVALRWLLQQRDVTAPIVGARTLDQLTDNLGATGWSLGPEALQRLTQAGDQDLPYPHNLQRMDKFVRRPSPSVA